jgi:hypothetical protein
MAVSVARVVDPEDVRVLQARRASVDRQNYTIFPNCPVVSSFWETDKLFSNQRNLNWLQGILRAPSNCHDACTQPPRK